MMKKLSTIFTMLVLASMFALGISLAVSSQAMALEMQTPVEDALSKAFKTEQKWLTNQQQAIDKADQAAVQIQQLIDKAAGEGLDVTILQNALAAFDAEMVSVKSEHQTAADILTAHNGFDGDGNVTDQQSARVTVLDAKQALWKAHVSMTQAVRNLHQAAREWRQVTFPKGE